MQGNSVSLLKKVFSFYLRDKVKEENNPIKSDTLCLNKWGVNSLSVQAAKKSNSAWLSFNKVAKNSSYRQIWPHHFPQEFQTIGFPARVALCSHVNILYIGKSLHCITLWLLRWRKSYFWAPTPAFPRWEAEFHACDLVRWACVSGPCSSRLSVMIWHNTVAVYLAIWCGCRCWCWTTSGLPRICWILRLSGWAGWWSTAILIDFLKRGERTALSISTADTIPMVYPQMHSGTAGNSQST